MIGIVSSQLRIWRQVRASLEADMARSCEAGDIDTADWLHGRLERHHWGRWRRFGGSLTAWDITVQMVADIPRELASR